MNKLVENIIREELQNFAKKNSLKSVLNSKEAYDILDNSSAGESTWCAGGCAILAFALNMIYGYQVFVIFDYDYNQIDHFIVKTGSDTYMDCDGEQRNILKRFMRREGLEGRQMEILPYNQELPNNGIPIDMNASKKLGELIKTQNIVREEVLNMAQEGVADKYAAQKFNIPDPNVEMNALALKGIPDDETGTYIGTTQEDSVKIFLNPKSLKNFGENTRAISDYDGNLFIAQTDGDFVHGEIARTINRSKDYQMKDPYYNYKDLVLWHRIGTTNVFGMSDSYYAWAYVNPEIANDLLDAAKHKNPQFSFQFNLWSTLLK